MKMRSVIFSLLLLSPTMSPAEEYIFQYDRFGAISLRTDRGGEHVSIENSEKEAPVETILKSRLVVAGPGVFKTPHGTVFILKHLSKPIINDGNRRINSGDWQLTVSGKGEEFTRIKPKLPKAAFGDTPPLVYLGEKAEAQWIGASASK